MRRAASSAMMPKNMARKGSKSTGSLARNLAISGAIAGLVGGLLVAVAVMQNLGGAVVDPDARSKGWLVGMALAVLSAVICGGALWSVGGKLATRVTDIQLAVSKLGRGGSEVRVRVIGNDEVSKLGSSVQYLASDLAALLSTQDDTGGTPASMDPMVKQLRDKTVPTAPPRVSGFEVDAAISDGSRGGLDYFDVVANAEDPTQAVAYVVTAEGHGATSIYACRLARDELQRALTQGATPRRALAHTNKVMKKHLPAGACAVATLLQMHEGGCKLYQAGARTPLLICQLGEVLELNAEGIALGLDAGPVFEKSLRPQEIEMSPGVRLVFGNDALLRSAGLLELLGTHSSRHTNMFMNMVLGTLEQDAGEDGLREDLVLITVKRESQG